MLLQQQNADPFRIMAYEKAARTLRQLGRPIAEIYENGGHTALTALPGIGDRIARSLEEIIQTGRWALLERLRGESMPESLFRTIPGIGPKLASAIYEHLHVDTLADLEAAAHDGRLEKVPGIGTRTAASIRASLNERLSRQRPRVGGEVEPDVQALLAIDSLYRDQAAARSLPTIAPRRFNPEHRAWLPILHTERDGWSYTAMYSNTARAHSLNRTNDWVVIYFSRDHHAEGQRTVVTETRGDLSGKRVVRGREQACRTAYA